jgi:hypothetical protein
MGFQADGDLKRQAAKEQMEAGLKDFQQAIPVIMDMLWDVYSGSIKKGFNPEQALKITLKFMLATLAPNGQKADNDEL